MLHESTPEIFKNKIDARILNLSYSSLLTLHSCPRKLQLQRLNSIKESTESQSESITFSFGHVVGLGIQLILERVSWQEIYCKLFLEWKPELFAENVKQNKSFSHAVFAVQKFKALIDSDYLDGYELVIYNGKPACELSFLISLPNGFKYRGFVDAVLQHKTSGKVVVLEVKTSSAATVNPATYKNSAQAIGYSIVLDTLFPTLSSYEVQYLVYSTKQYQYDSLQFTKSYVQRARWIRELILDTEIISMYESNDLYPMRGESCYSFFRECEYLGLCQMDTDKLTSPITPELEESLLNKESEYQIQITLEDLITSQINRS